MTADENLVLTGQKEALISDSEKKSEEKKQSQGRLTGTLLFAVAISTFGGSFQFGYNIGCVNAPEKVITEWYNESYYATYNQTMTKSQNELAWSSTVGIFAFGGIFGGIMTGWLADKFGRKGALLYNNVFAILAQILMTSAKFFDVFLLIIIGRFIIGFNSGLNSGLVPMYLTEISPKNLRGALGSTCQLLVTTAILISMILGLPFIFGNTLNWPIIFGLIIVPVLVNQFCLPICPESPKYTLIVKNNRKEAEEDLRKLRGESNVLDELDAIQTEATLAQNQPKVTFSNMFGKSLRYPLFLAVMMMLAQQFSGINAVMFYSTKIFEDAKLPGNGPFYATIAIGAINVIQTLISVWLVDHPKFGRRSLLLTGLIGMCVSSVFISVFLTLSSIKDLTTDQYKYQWASYGSILFVLLFVVSFATGPGSIPWFFVSEIFPSNARGNANSIACLSNWTANFFVATSFLFINKALGHYTFLVFAALLAFFIIFTYKFIPETKNRSVEEIHKDIFKGKQQNLLA